MSKFIFRHAIHKLVENERQKVLECLRPNIQYLLYDIEGVKLFFEVYNYSNTKERKDIIKLIKPEISNILKSDNSSSYMVILKLLHSTDDTVLLEKSVTKELLSFLSSVYDDKRIFNIVFSVFSPLNHNNNIMHKWEPKIHYTTNKKEQSMRLGEVRTQMIQSVIESLKQRETSEMLTHENIQKLVVALIAYVAVGT